MPFFVAPDYTRPQAFRQFETEAFEDSAVNVVYIPDGCEDIGEYAFKNSKALRQIRLPENCRVARTAFEGCTSLIAVYAPAGGTVESWCREAGIPFAAE